MTLGERAEAALRVVREAKEMAYDTETSGVDWKVNSCVGYVITADGFNDYIPVRHGGGGNLLDPNCGPLTTPNDVVVQHSFERDLAKAFEERRRRGFLTIGHNLLFDMHMSANHDIYLGRECEDTQLTAAMLDEFCKSFSLDNVAKGLKVTAKLGQDMYDHLAQLFGVKAEKGSMEHFWRTDGQDPMVIDYSCGDGTSTLEAARAQRGLIADEEMQLIHNIESRLIWTVFRIERRGIKISEERIETVQAAVKAQVIKTREKLPDGFNERSGPQIKALFEEAGLTNWPTTAASSKFPEGQPSFTEKFLKKSELGKSIIAIRKLTNLDNSFITPLKERHVYHGRVHSHLNQLKGDEYGTISGRFSSSDPNLQQVPKRDKDIGRPFRSLFIPDDGMDFYEADYSQCEPRLFAHYSQEPALVEGYSQTPFKDMHAVVAEMFHVERDPTAKRMNMGILTGMQVESFAGHMGWELDEALRMFNMWFEGFPGIRRFQDKAKGVFKNTGFVKTLLGRRCRLDHPRFAYRATSRVIQGGNADIIKAKLLEIDEFFESEGDIAHLLMTIHDSVNAQAPKGEVGSRIIKEMVRIMEDVRGAPFNLRVPFVVDVGKGSDWSIATYGPSPATT